MNRVISDTAEYGCYLFDHAAKPLLAGFMSKIETNVIGKNFNTGIDAHVDNKELIRINEEIRYHEVELVGQELREAMEAMEAII
jgi:ketol-acid reductoisomerase